MIVGNHLSPLDGMSSWLQKRLLDAGWKPGTSRLNKRTMFGLQMRRVDLGILDAFEYCSTTIASPAELNHPAHPAFQILEELYGLRLECDIGEEYRSDVRFDLEEVSHAVVEINALSSILKTRLVPVGEVMSESYVLVDAHGAIFLSGWVGSGVFRAGDSFDAGMTSLLSGKRLKLMQFTPDEDPTDQFKY